MALSGVRLFTSATPAGTALRYICIVAVGNLVWEVAQLPLFTLWRTASPAYIAFAVVHCWIGDLLIASTTLLIGLGAAGRTWPERHSAGSALITVLSGLVYTVFSEWLNVVVRGTWTYASAMPRVPPLGTGLAPLLQWLIVPVVGFVWARKPGSLSGEESQ